MSRWGMDRFAQVSVEHGGRRVHAWRATCVCGVSQDFPWTGGRTRSPPEMIAKKLIALGWDIGSTSRRDLCPACVAAQRVKPVPIVQPKEEVPMAPAPATPPPPPPPIIVPATPREPTREDRRRVLDALEEHWSHAGGCYAKSFTDKSLAEKLNVPRIWVTAIREEFFGAESNEAAVEHAKTLSTLCAKAKVLEDRALTLAADAEALRAEVRKAMGKAA